MLRQTLIISVMLSVPLLSGAAIAGDASLTSVADVQTLLGDCQQPPASPEWAYCVGVLQGVGSILSANGYLLSTGAVRSTDLQKVSICTTDSNSPAGDELIATFIGWATAHPEASSDPDVIGAAQAFASQWPCAT